MFFQVTNYVYPSFRITEMSVNQTHSFPDKLSLYMNVTIVFKIVIIAEIIVYLFVSSIHTIRNEIFVTN